MCKYLSPPFVCGALYLVSELLKSKATLLVLKHDSLAVEDSKTVKFMSFRSTYCINGAKLFSSKPGGMFLF